MGIDASVAVSVIVVNWNGKRWLQRCLESLLQQQGVAVEIIVVDNASSDGSAEYVQSNYPAIRLVRSDSNRGFAGGNNLGIAAASGQWILMLNNDAWLDAHAVRDLVGFATTAQVDVVGAIEVGYDDDIARDSGRNLIDWFGHPIPADSVGRSDFFYLSGVCLLFEKKTYFETGGLDNDFFMYFEETDWFWRLHALGKKAKVAEAVHVHHAGHGSSGAQNKLNCHRFLWRNQNCLQMLLKNHSATHLLWVLPLYVVINIFELSIFAAIGRFDIAKSYLQGWVFNFRNIHAIIEKRRNIRGKKKCSDADILRHMYRGSGKLVHLRNWLKRGAV